MKYSGSLYFYNEETEAEFELEIEFRYHYDPGRYYMPNGDPGYPSEETADIVRYLMRTRNRIGLRMR